MTIVEIYFGRVVLRCVVNAAELCQILHHLLVEAPVLNAVKEAAQHLGGVLQRFLFAHLTAVCVQIGDMRSEEHTSELQSR